MSSSPSRRSPDPPEIWPIAKGIGLIELRKPTDEDWGPGMTDVRGEVNIDNGFEMFDVGFRRAEPIPESEDVDLGEKTYMRHLVKVSIPSVGYKTLEELSRGGSRRNARAEAHYELDCPSGTVLTTPEDFPAHREWTARCVRGMSC